MPRPKPEKLKKNDFRVVEIKKGKHKYIAVYIKGKRGQFTSARKSKTITKSSVRQTLEHTNIIQLNRERLFEQAGKQKTQKKIIKLFRVTQAHIYEGRNEYRFGQIRVWAITYSPDRYPAKKMNSIIEDLRTKYGAFRESSFTQVIAREVRLIGHDELTPLDTVFAQNFNQNHIVRKRVEQRKDVIYFQIIGKGFKPPVTGVYV